MHCEGHFVQPARIKKLKMRDGAGGMKTRMLETS